MLAGYARVSTLDQNPELQLDALRAAGCERIFEDRASGTRADRPGLAEALDWMRRGDTLAVWRLDRLGRSLPQLVATVRRLEEKGLGFRSLTEGIDTTTASGTLVFHVFGALAQFERDLIRERTMAGLAAAQGPRKEGRAAGQADAQAPPPGRGDAAGHEGLPVHQRRDPQLPDRPHRVLRRHFPKERIRIGADGGEGGNLPISQALRLKDRNGQPKVFGTQSTGKKNYYWNLHL